MGQIKHGLQVRSIKLSMFFSKVKRLINFFYLWTISVVFQNPTIY